MAKSILLLPLCFLLAPNSPHPQVTNRPIRSSLASQDPLPDPDPVAFLEKCLTRYDQDGIRGFTAVLHKQERIGGELQPSEECEVYFREKPHSVMMNWLKGQRKANRVLYVEGENNGQMLVNPAGLAGRFVSVAARDVEGADARSGGRYVLKDFGLRKAVERSATAWKTAQQNGTLKVEYLGVHKVKEVGDRLCYKLRRTCAKPEEDGILEVTLYIDKETWLQVGSVIKGAEGKLIGEYMFRDVKLNPTFAPDQFTRAALTK